jgi:2,3-bisphosphoglycerate-dependent phosphoglycerate mutase
MEQIKIIFMRHGRSQADDEEVHEGWYDSPLTDTGREQVNKRAAYFKKRDIKFDTIISSPFLRAKESAAIVCEAIAAPIEFDEDWKEINNGPLAGMSREEAARKYPKPEFRNPYESFWELGEGDWEAYRRASRAVESVIRKGPGSYLVVAHGGILNHALRTIIGVQPPINWQGIIFPIGDAGFIRMEYRVNTHQWYLLEMKAG